MPKSFIDFIEDCGKEAKGGKVSPTADKFSEMLKPGRTPEELLQFFTDLGVNVTKGDCIRLQTAARSAQGPTPTEYQPKY
jgi:hypothetical protein